MVLMLRLDIILDHVVSWTFFAPVPDNDARTPHNLASLTLGIKLAQASPFSKLHVGIDFDKGDLK